ncbi:MAG: hypothetical protein LBD40_01285 [Puniceicoccales bacterium]|nr:hypothetical protein [Puniceicoccales bacterium]
MVSVCELKFQILGSVSFLGISQAVIFLSAALFANFLSQAPTLSSVSFPAFAARKNKSSRFIFFLTAARKAGKSSESSKGGKFIRTNGDGIWK